MSTMLATVWAHSWPGRVVQRLQLSVAKHRSLAGHPRIALWLARRMPGYAYSEVEAFGVDAAPEEVVAQRRRSFGRVRDALNARAPRTLAATEALTHTVSDAAFVDANRVPFQFREVARALRVGNVVSRTEGAQLCDLDGNWSYDLTGAYGVNLLGSDAYKRFMDQATAEARDLGLVLGPYHPVVADNVRRLLEISRMDEVSFHMSGTEAVMQAVRLARYHTGRKHIVRFVGAYHGWWDGVQAGPGNPVPARDVYTLPEMSARTLDILRSRRDIACVLVNPLQAMSPNGSPGSDSTLVSNDRSANYDKAAYSAWLAQLREVCTERGIALILDEVFLGFRLALGGAQAYFGVQADLVTYGKTLGGGLPVGALCGKAAWMKRFRDDKPADICFARGTFNSHPYVMTAMNAFLQFITSPEGQAPYARLDETWNARVAKLNGLLQAEKLPVRVANMTSIVTTLFCDPGRYHWMFQYYLRLQGLTPAWTGSARFIFTHDTTEATFDEIAARFVSAARAMREDGWWWTDTTLTSKKIKRQVLTEVVRTAFGLRARPAPAPAAAQPAIPEKAAYGRG